MLRGAFNVPISELDHRVPNVFYGSGFGTNEESSSPLTRLKNTRNSRGIASFIRMIAGLLLAISFSACTDSPAQTRFEAPPTDKIVEQFAAHRFQIVASERRSGEPVFIKLDTHTGKSWLYRDLTYASRSNAPPFSILAGSRSGRTSKRRRNNRTAMQNEFTEAGQRDNHEFTRALHKISKI
jgi:hypothetical protein